jgi:uncharacterized membrane protein
MEQGASVWLVLLALLLGANAPYFSSRILLLGPRRSRKPAGWLMLELVLLAGLMLLLGFGLEARLGQRAPQGWEFYAAVLALFITLGFPGFVWRYLRRSAVREDEPDA